MKTIIVLAFTTVTATGAMGVSASQKWAAAFDARPEALMIGASLLLVASLIRHRFTRSSPKIIAEAIGPVRARRRLNSAIPARTYPQEDSAVR